MVSACAQRWARLQAVSVANTYKSVAPPLFSSPAVVHARRPLRARPGLLAYKRGVVSFFFGDGTQTAATVLEVDRCQVVQVKNTDTNGYCAVQLGVGAKRTTNVKRPELGHFARAQVAPKRHLVEFQVKNEDGLLPVGTELRADHLRVGQFVDVKAKSKGKGFQGVMKRWGFGGMPASHGVSAVHRSAGSTGQNTDPARVFPGKKMAGRMGFDNRTVQNLQVLKVEPDSGLIFLKGHVPGAKGRLVRVLDALKKPMPDTELEF